MSEARRGQPGYVAVRLLRCAVLVGCFLLVLGCREPERKNEAPALASAALRARASQVAPSPSVAPSVSDEPLRTTTLLYVRMPAGVTPLQRVDQFEAPLDAELRDRRLGEVKSGGTALRADGGVKHAGFEVRVRDVESALPVITETLRKLQAPRSTTIEVLSDDGPALVHSVW